MLSPSSTTLSLTAQRLVRSPNWSRRLAISLVVLFLLLIPVLLFVPWQQTSVGAGRVIAFTPLERQQSIEAPISGRVTTWFVQEGDTVKAGDPIAEITDNDPLRLERLQMQNEALLVQLTSAEEKVMAYERKRDATATARVRELARIDAKIEVLRQKIRAAEEILKAERLGHKTAEQQLDRVTQLASEGLESTRKLELAQLKEETARVKEQKAGADLRIARSELLAEQAYRAKIESEYDSKNASIEADLQGARADVSGYDGKRLDLESKIARQRSQRIHAPRDGVIFRLEAKQGAEQVKSGDTLARLVPTAGQLAVELWVDGNDVTLVRTGHKVRLQFEGWPALQFSGWPSVAVGTFGGEVSFVDAADDGEGRFRLVVVPDPEDDPWPEASLLRQGVRVRGWVLLAEVSIGFELWRQINGFPPSVGPPSSQKDNASKTKDSK